MQDIIDPILSEEELAIWLDTSRPTLQRQRSDGSGPPFVQLSERRIGYRKSAVERWLDSRTIARIGALICTNRVTEPRPIAGAGTVLADPAQAAPQVQRPPRRRTRGAA